MTDPLGPQTDPEIDGPDGRAGGEDAAPGPKLRIVLVDDHDMIRSGLRALIDAQDDMDVVGEACDAEEACREAEALRPHVVIMDVSMPGVGGAAATERIVAAWPEVRVLALTFHEDRGYLQLMVRAGASGFLLKRAAAGDLIQAIRIVARGGTYLYGGLAAEVVVGLIKRVPRADPLSDREEEVLRLIARGYTNREIAERLDISVKTVETHRSRCMDKLAIESRADIVGYAIRQGWLAEG